MVAFPETCQDIQSTNIMILHIPPTIFAVAGDKLNIMGGATGIGCRFVPYMGNIHIHVCVVCVCVCVCVCVIYGMFIILLPLLLCSGPCPVLQTVCFHCPLDLLSQHSPPP